MSTKIEDLSPAARPRAEAFIAALDAKGIPYAITCTFRTVDEQVALYAQGRAPLEIVNLLRKKAGLSNIGLNDNTYHVTNCDGVNILSPHQGRDALDVVPMVNGKPVWPPLSDQRWRQIAEVGEAAGFTWGGRWQDFPDFPHYQAA